MGATNSCSKTAWEIKAAFYRVTLGVYIDFQEALEKSFVAPKWLYDNCYTVQ
jgi:hypothetical protein